MQATTDWSKTVRVEVRGDDVVGHAGNVIPRMLADNLGLTSGLSAALSRPEVTHDRGAVLRDVAVSIAGGAQNLAGTAVLRNQQRLFGAVASVPTMWRSLNEIDRQGMAGGCAGAQHRPGAGVGVDRGSPWRDPAVADLLWGPGWRGRDPH
ncbi:hypothetical protein MDOR_04620 [Mycolicibacterium doricum]|uniref:Transposase DDE domain-containing protein n=1 Tax=Mycolicibacterium doricum TaxID=126673 RepID=A0A7I7VQ63_9MYCO|nr:transposase [Mycolicibacterium doricum]BBZ06293.1 hypothetical protein MDOR_04620 [Mycolicibacterium doricum]